MHNIEVSIVFILFTTDYNYHGSFEYPRSTGFIASSIHRGLYSLETASQYCRLWSHLNDLSAFWRPQYFTTHPSACSIRLWQHSVSGLKVTYQFKVTGEKRGSCVSFQANASLTSASRDAQSLWFSVSHSGIVVLQTRLEPGRWEVMNVARAQAGGKWWMATITPDHQWRLHKAASQRNWLLTEFL